MGTLFNSLLFVAFLAFIAASWILTINLGRKILKRWAADNGYQIVSFEHRGGYQGPFTWNSSKLQMTYYVVVKTADEQTRRGWVRCGSYAWGVMHDEVEFVEDKPAIEVPGPQQAAILARDAELSGPLKLPKR